MRTSRHLGCAAVLLIAVLLAAGCTTPAPAAPAAPQAVPSAQQAATQGIPAATAAARTADIDTVISVHYNDFACLDVQKELGKTYLYPDEKYKLSAAAPGVSGVNVNVVFLDENDQLGVRQIKPQWDSVRKTWVYEGIVPLAQFNDITVPVEKTFTIKTQSKYYICADDRKDPGTSDVVYRVPVKLTRL
jgi:hypothetical protein